MSTAAPRGYEGGAGGKFRKKPFRKATTPYDRPVIALRNPVEGGSSNGWLSKIVDPASRVITRSAHKFFSSVFRKRLPAPETVPEAEREPRNVPSETVYASQNPFGVDEREPVVNGNDSLNNHSENNGLDELEQILKQKTFTRAEIDHLTQVLRSRTVDIPAEDEYRRSEPSTSQPLVDNHKLELANVPVQENRVDTRRLLGEASVPAANSSVLEKAIASPAELAKAYMGNRPSKVSPSTLGLRSQVLREELPSVSNVPFPRKSSGLSLVPRSSVRFAGVPGVSENGYQTPRSRGRSAIYSMVRTPYSRIHSAGKGIETMEDGYVGQSTSPWILENDTLSIGKQVSKRRSSVLDNDIGSVGPIRRIRQKTNLMSLKSSGLLVPESLIPTRGTAFSPDVAKGSVSSTQKPLLLEESKYNIPKMRLAEDGDNSVPSTSFASVPSQSSEMARKILQQLDKLVPSPKEKSAELKLDIAREKSPAKLSVSMLHGKALRSVEEVDSSKLLNNVQNTGTLDGVGGTSLRVTQDSASQKLDKVEENVPLKIAGSGNKFSLESNGAERTTLKKDSVPSFRTADSAISNSVVTPPQRKRAFQMSVYEDFLELDDDCYSTKGAHTAGVNEILENAAVEESKAVAAETVTVEKPPVSEVKTPASLILNRSSDTGASDGPKVNEKNPGIAVPVTSPSSIVAQPATLSQLPPLFSNVVSMKETTVPVFNFGSKGVDNAPPFTFSSTSSFSEASGLKSGAQTILKLEALSSPATIAESATETMTKAAESDKDGEENALRTGDLSGKHENATFAGATSTTSGIFSFNSSSNNSNLSNGSVAPSPSLFSVPASPSLPSSTGSANVIFTSGPTTAAVTTTSSLSSSAAAPAFSSAAIFQFGSSTTVAVAPSSSMSQPSTASGAESTDLEQKSKTAPPFGNLSHSPFGATSSPLTSTGSGIFGFTSVAPASTTNSSSSANNLSNAFGAGTGAVYGSQTASGTGSSPFTQSISSQFGSSTPSPTFGLSSSSTFTTGSSMFGSSAPASKQFSSGSGFAQKSSTTFSTGSNPFSSASGAANLFSSGSQPASSMFSPAISSAPTTGFSFGGASTSGVANGSASSPATGLSFGVSSTAGAASASTLATGFSFGGPSTAGAATGSAPMVFGSGNGVSSGPFFSFTSSSAASSSATLASSQPVFGAPNPSIPFSSSPTNDQMSMEDSMAEDTIQASTPAVPTFGQPAATPSPGFMFNSAPSGTPFQFGAQQNPVAPQNSSPFQAPSNFDFAAGGSFSLGTTGDKSTRKFIRPKRDKMRKK
ncbi:nuclear pore complex protein NUP1-like isoform X2 [Telopea speciosissima]|uniref:nuclear pore complex protein NUP1-like isoform X2 n=1 Tax=Telopea speciosissima TaxID=54955 RepID=UPI001CC63299|nr:nuclear pore complex protein NUP1-like isoform X2 [Telopea speciosissima]